MHPDWHEEWEDFPDDWYDGADELLNRSHIVYLEMCLSKPSAIKGDKPKDKPN